MTTWGELARVTQALLLQSADLVRTARELARESGEAVERSCVACRRTALLCEQARRLRRGLPPA
jgi:hypothetical protein